MSLSRKLLGIKLERVRRRSCQRLYILHLKTINDFKVYLDNFAQGDLLYEMKLREYFS